MLMAQSGQEFPEEHIPTIFENYICRINLDKSRTSLNDSAKFLGSPNNSSPNLHRLGAVAPFHPNGDSTQVVELSLWDTAGQEDYDRLRPLSYPDTDIVLLTFSVADWGSFDNIREKWFPETHHFLPDVPRLLVGNKIDLRDNPASAQSLLATRGVKCVSTEEGTKLASQINALKYFECSAKTKEGITDLFYHAARIAMKKDKKMKSCKVL
ncbi:hypothetical protein HDV00_003302 [Rhizophlyctis rosea]|nr:hypothetical protein HDV00_003302 [Rhizophlyctis rosea]